MIDIFGWIRTILVVGIIGTVIIVFFWQLFLVIREKVRGY